MIKLKKVSLKNFLSVGNVEQSVLLDKDELSLVLGENLDSSSNLGARNGVGKSTIIQAISYALYGSAITQIKKDNLINKTNSQKMVVSLEFEKNGAQYKIERGRRPNFLRWYVNNNIVNAPNTNESEGDSRVTQIEIEKVIGLSHSLFRHIIVMNTFTEPFLSLPVGMQRTIIEELFGITQLSIKAEKLKEKIKNTKDLIREEEIKIQSIKESNATIQKSIDDLKLKSSAWEKEKNRKIKDLEKKIVDLNKIEIYEEIECQKKLEKIIEYENSLSAHQKLKKQFEKNKASIEKNLILLSNDLELLTNNECPTCKQGIMNHTHEELIKNCNEKINNLLLEEKEILAEIEKISVFENEILIKLQELGEKPKVFYKNLEEAYSHKQILEKLISDLNFILEQKTPYEDQIHSLSNNSIKEISYNYINELSNLRDHQEYLLKFLVSKDSFIRKKIIDQNLNYLNYRLSHYLTSLGLPHKVTFLNDLSVEITELGLEYDFDNLSRGERTRLILSLGWAFRDVFEMLNSPINMLFIDELIDNGLDQDGVENSISVLKQISRERNKNIFLISHREELINRVSNILMVVKENGFTSFQHI